MVAGRQEIVRTLSQSGHSSRRLLIAGSSVARSPSPPLPNTPRHVEQVTTAEPPPVIDLPPLEAVITKRSLDDLSVREPTAWDLVFALSSYARLVESLESPSHFP